jgi:catechol 2,3-dioxygenase-like lactoylglutathione lyase family enzyme
MITSLASVTLLVKDYDEAIRWYTEKLGLELRMDGSMGSDYRSVTVGILGQEDVSIVLHKPVEEKKEASSNVHGLLFNCDNRRDIAKRLKSDGVEFTLEPEEQPWGVRAVFQDPYENSHVLLEPSPMALG